MPSGRERLLYATFVSLLVALALVPGASAAEREAVQAPPTVSFADERLLTVDTATLAKEGGLSVLIHNDSARGQEATLQVVGAGQLTDEGARAILSTEPVTPKRELGPGQSLEAKIPLGSGVPDPTPGTYSLLLVVSGGSGGLSRRELTIVAGGGAKKADRGAALSPEGTQNVTLVAVNYLPSPLSGLSWLSLAAGLLCGAVLFVIWGSVSSQIRLGVIALGVFLVTIGSVHGFNHRLSAGESWHAISSRPLAVAAGSAQGTVGTPSSESGQLARLEVKGTRMRPQNLSHAGTYKGPYDLAPEVAEKGGGEATIDVRDWWPWAALTLALGVLIGYLLRRWYQVQRPQAKLKLRRERIVARIATEEEDFARIADGAPIAHFSIERRLVARLGEIDAKIAEGDTKAAEAMDQLEAYLSRFARLRTTMGALFAARQRLGMQILEEGFGVRLEDRDLTRILDAALATTVDSADPDGDSKILEAAEVDLGGARKLAEAAAALHASIAVHMRRAEACAAARPGGGTDVDFEAMVNAFKGFGEELLHASKLETVEAIEVKDDAEVAKLEALIVKSGVVATVELTPMPAVSDAHVSQPGVTAAADAGATTMTLGMRRGDEAPAGQAFEIGYEVAGAADSKQTIHRGDELLIHVAVPNGLGAGITGFEVDLGEGTEVDRLSLEAHLGPAMATVARRMDEGGDFEIRVRALPGGDEGGSGTLPIAVDPQTRVEELEAALARTERLMSRLGFVLAVGSGMVALYVGEAAWGESADYVKALLWGGTVSEGVKLASVLAERTWISG